MHPPLSIPRLAVLALALLGGFSAQAHFFWWEVQDREARLQFGMFGQPPVRPEVLARRQGFSAWAEEAGGTTHRLEMHRSGTSWVAPLPENATWLCLSDETLPVKDLTSAGYGPCRIIMFSRRPVGNRRERSTLSRFVLDALPSRNGHNVEVTFRGKPLPRAKVLLHDAQGGTTTLITRKSGIVSLPKGTSGPVVVQVLWKEEAAGTFEGREHSGILYSISLSLAPTHPRVSP